MRIGATWRQIPRLVHLARMPMDPTESVGFAPDGLRLVGLIEGRVASLDPLDGASWNARLGFPGRRATSGSVPTAAWPCDSCLDRRPIPSRPATSFYVGCGGECPRRDYRSQAPSTDLTWHSAPIGGAAAWSFLARFRTWDLASGREARRGSPPSWSTTSWRCDGASRVPRPPARSPTRTNGDSRARPIWGSGQRGRPGGLQPTLGASGVVFDDGRQVAVSAANNNFPWTSRTVRPGLRRRDRPSRGRRRCTGTRSPRSCG